MYTTEILCRNQHYGTSSNFAHGTDNRKIANFILYKFKANSGSSFFVQKLKIIFRKSWHIECRNECLSVFYIFFFFLNDRFNFEDEIRLKNIFVVFNDLSSGFTIFRISKFCTFSCTFFNQNLMPIFDK